MDSRDKAVFVAASVTINPKMVHELRPASDFALLTPQPSYMLCLNPDERGLCQTHLVVRAKDLAPVLFPA